MQFSRISDECDVELTIVCTYAEVKIIYLIILIIHRYSTHNGHIFDDCVWSGYVV